MSEPTDQIVRIVTTRNERKELLILACAADRGAWLAACRQAPARSRGAQLASDLLGYLEPLSSVLPGRLGRWLRGASFLTNLGRQFGWLRL